MLSFPTGMTRPRGLPGLHDLGGRSFRDDSAFGVHFVVRNVVRLDGKERSRTDVKRDKAAIYPGPVKFGQERVVEMQRSGRRGDGAALSLAQMAW